MSYVFYCNIVYIYSPALQESVYPRLARIHTHIYMYTYIYIYVYIYVCIYVYMYVYICVCIYICICIHIYIYICIYIYMYKTTEPIYVVRCNNDKGGFNENLVIFRGAKLPGF